MTESNGLPAEHQFPDHEWDLLDEIQLLHQVAPRSSAPAATWIAWHERHATYWDQIAAQHRVVMDGAKLMARSHRQDITELRANPDSQLARPDDRDKSLH
ncbi:hypothetical protein [Actinophytocola sediminis]